MPRGVYKRGDTYWITWADLQGKRHREAVGTSVTAAVRAREQRMVDRRDAKFRMTGPKLPTLQEFVDAHWRAEVEPTLKPSTRAGYAGLLEHHVLAAFGKLKLDDITRAKVRAFIAERAQTHQPNTIRNAVSLLSSILVLASEDHELLPGNPIAGMTKSKYYPSQHEKLATVHWLEPAPFVAAVNKLRVGPIHDAVRVLALTGLRWGEFRALTPTDVDLRANRLHVTKAMWGKAVQRPKSAGSVRAVDMTPTVRRILSVLSPLVIPSHKTLYLAWYRSQSDAGVPADRQIRLHDLRHQYAVLNIMAGKHPKWLQRQMGHADIRVTMDVYGGLMETIPITPVEWIDDLLPGLGQRFAACDVDVTAPPEIIGSNVAPLGIIDNDRIVR